MTKEEIIDFTKEIAIMNYNSTHHKYKIINNVREIEIGELGFNHKINDFYKNTIDTMLTLIHENYINLYELPLPSFSIRPNIFLDDKGRECEGEYMVTPPIKGYNLNELYHIVLEISISKEDFIENLLHEFGHHIHYLIYNYKRIQWYKEDLSEYGKTNNHEAFAEVFKELVENIDNKNTRKMRKLFNKI